MKSLNRTLVISFLLLNVVSAQAQETPSSVSSSVVNSNHAEADKKLVIDFLDSDPEAVISSVVVSIFDDGDFEDIYTEHLLGAMQYLIEKYHSGRIIFSKIDASVEDNNMIFDISYVPNDSDIEDRVKYTISREKAIQQKESSLADLYSPHAIRKSIIQLLESDPKNVLHRYLVEAQKNHDRFSESSIEDASKFLIEKYERRLKFTMLTPVVDVKINPNDFVITIHYTIDETGVKDQVVYRISKDEVTRRKEPPRVEPEYTYVIRQSIANILNSDTDGNLKKEIGYAFKNNNYNEIINIKQVIKAHIDKQLTKAKVMQVNAKILQNELIVNVKYKLDISNVEDQADYRIPRDGSVWEIMQ